MASHSLFYSLLPIGSRLALGKTVNCSWSTYYGLLIYWSECLTSIIAFGLHVLPSDAGTVMSSLQEKKLGHTEVKSLAWCHTASDTLFSALYFFFDSL